MSEQLEHHSVPSTIFEEHMNYINDGNRALVNGKGEEKPLKAGDFALVKADEKHYCRNTGRQALQDYL